MAKPYKLTESAKIDFKEIIAYIARDNPPAAKRVRSDFNEAFLRLSQYPMMGHLRQDITEKSPRFWPVHSYQIIYNPESSPLAIVRILSGYRDISDLLGD